MCTHKQILKLVRQILTGERRRMRGQRGGIPVSSSLEHGKWRSTNGLRQCAEHCN